MLTPAERGRIGGKATVAKYGHDHMRRIGKLGFAALARKLGFAGGSRRTALAILMRDGRIKRAIDLSPAQFHDLAVELGLEDDDQADLVDLPY